VPDQHSILTPFLSWLYVAVVAGIAVLPLWWVRPHGWPPQRRRALSWGGAHVAAAFVVFWFMPALIYPLVDPDLLGRWLFGQDVDAKTGKTLSMAAAGILALPLQLLAWRGLLTTVEPHPIRLFAPRHTAREVRVGYMTWLVVAPAVYLIGLGTFVIHAWLGGQSEPHPLLNMFESGPLPSGVVILLFTQAVIAAPVAEELLFRGILLPWLADRPWSGIPTILISAILGVSLRWRDDINWSDLSAVAGRFAPALLALAMIPLVWTCERWSGLQRWIQIRDSATRSNVVWAIAASSALFANIHANVWPTPVPLIVLSVSLGWLAVRTQSVIGPMVVHILFNAVAMIGEMYLR
jgi:membrane protease YdiL (CAAX protease family)